MKEQQLDEGILQLMIGLSCNNKPPRGLGSLQRSGRLQRYSNRKPNEKNEVADSGSLGGSGGEENVESSSVPLRPLRRLRLLPSLLGVQKQTQNSFELSDVLG